jgi:hypothetical protein
MWKNAVRVLNGQPTWLIVSLSFVLLVLGWQLLVSWGNYPAFILPGPLDVGRQFLIVMGDGRLARHSLITISEIIPGLLILDRLPGDTGHRHRTLTDDLGDIKLLGARMGGGVGCLFPDIGYQHRWNAIGSYRAIRTNAFVAGIKGPDLSQVGDSSSDASLNCGA